MARAVNFDLSPSWIEAGLETPVDEDGVHDSFSQLIADQSRSGDQRRAFELQPLHELEEDGGASFLPSPRHGGRRREDRQEDGDRRIRETDTLLGERWSSDTLKVLSSMPSRTIGRSRGAIISQYYNRTMQLRRRRQSRPAIQDFSRSARPSIRGYGVESDITDAEGLEVSKKDHLVNNLQNLSVGDRIRMLREMPLSLSEKSELRMLASQKEQRSFSRSQLPCCSQLKYYIIIALRHSWYSWLSLVHALQLWQVALKRVSGRFGSGVLSYFLFLKTLLFLNVFLAVVTTAFVVLPQAVHTAPPAAQRLHFSGLELLTGAGYFTDTVMYYGFYSNHTLRSGCRDEACEAQRLSYNMPLAYFFTIGVALFLTCIILVYSMSKSFGQSFRIDKTHSILAMKVFSSWDFNVVKKTSVKLMSENIGTQIKELLAEVNHQRVQKSVRQKLWRLMVHSLSWTICIGSTAGCILALYHFSHHMHQDQQLRSRTSDLQLREASLLAVPVGVSFINLLLPALFSAAAWMEDYESPSVGTYVAISRHLMLKGSVLGVLCYHWLARVAADPQSLSLQCWETFVGQELFRFLLMDFIFTLLDTLFGEFLWRLFCEKVLKKKRKPVFDIAKNVLELIYGQTLAWLGILFTPLLPAVQVLKLLLLFYIKKGSVMMNCQAPRTPYRVSQMTTIFITLLCFPSFLGASVCLTYTMWSIMPSASCGPFRSLKTMFQSGKLWMAQLEQDNPRLSVLARAHAYLVENPLFLFIGAGIFLIIIYFHSQVVDGQRKIITLLQEQIENEGEDKKFLITRLQMIHENKRSSAQKPSTRVDP